MVDTLLEKRREIAPERMKRLSQSTTWNVRSMNQGKLEVVKQEMARININILGISELKWMGMGKFNSDDHCLSTIVGKTLLEEMK